MAVPVRELADLVMPLVDEGLGNSAYLVDLGDGRALAVDAPRDLRALRAVADRRGLRVAFAADTHLHADFLSGAVQLGADAGAQILASATGARAFEHHGLLDGDETDLGGLTLRALATPGHTDEHLSFLLLDGDTPIGVFTGGSLLVGSAARTDLLGDEHTVALARAQYASVHRLAALPPLTAVWPTHGGGSFCSAVPGGERTSTIGEQRASNPLLAAPDVDTFITRLLRPLGSYPAYFRRLSEHNRRGPAVLGPDPTLPGLSVQEVRRAAADGALVLDVRPVADVAAGHVPGSVAVPLRGQFATWLGWIAGPDTPIVVVRNPDQDPADILWPALNIGVDTMIGELDGGIRAWTGAGQDVATIPLVAPDQVLGAVLDIRQDSEYAAGHLPQAQHIELGDLAAHADQIDQIDQIEQVDQGPTVVMCGHGERALTAATLLRRAGHRDVSVLDGGAHDWAEATGHDLHQQ